jgi:hypothetical protein
MYAALFILCVALFVFRTITMFEEPSSPVAPPSPDREATLEDFQIISSDPIEPHLNPSEVYVRPAGRIRANGRRVVSVADIHGDYIAFIQILIEARLLSYEDGETKWAGGNAIFIQTGDIVDRYIYSAYILRLLAKIQRQARAVGGDVILLMGNHEVMNLMGYFYENPLEDAGFAPQTRAEAFEKDTGEFGNFIRSFPVAVIIEMIDDSPESGILFVHAGIEPHFLDFNDTNPIDKLNRDMRWFTDKPMKHLKQYYKHPLMTDPGPLWSRLFEDEKDETIVQAAVDETLSVCRAGKMVVGHSFQLSRKVRTRCGGKIVLGDVGMSVYYNGRRLALEHFTNGSFSEIEV